MASTSTLPNATTRNAHHRIAGAIAAMAHGLTLSTAVVWMIAVLPDIASAQGAPIYRCGSGYSQVPCPGGHAIADQLSTLHGSTTAPPGQATVYLCQGNGGGQFWSSSHCGQHQASIERMETVPSSLPWSQQVQQAQTQREQAQRLSDPHHGQHYRHPPQRAAQARQRASDARQEQRSQQREQQHTANCDALRARLAKLDAQGRAGSQQTDLETLRAQRRQTREEMRQLGC